MIKKLEYLQDKPQQRIRYNEYEKLELLGLINPQKSSEHEKLKDKELYDLVKDFLSRDRIRYDGLEKCKNGFHLKMKETRSCIEGPYVRYLDNFGYYYSEGIYIDGCLEGRVDEFVTALGDVSSKEAFVKLISNVIKWYFDFYNINKSVKRINYDDKNIKLYAACVMALFEDFFGSIDEEIIKWFNEYLNYGFCYHGNDSDKYELYFKFDNESHIEVNKKKVIVKQRTIKPLI